MSEYRGVPPEMTVKEYGRRVYMLQHGASKREWHCLRQLWTEESHWNYKAKNQSGGAYGIPQAKPANKMAVSGADWKTNPATQIKWGLKYLKSRYNFSACSALKHKHRRGWY
jgi:membrane-bound lytic murein transglycosylase MltF